MYGLRVFLIEHNLFILPNIDLSPNLKSFPLFEPEIYLKIVLTCVSKLNFVLVLFKLNNVSKQNPYLLPIYSSFNLSYLDLSYKFVSKYKSGIFKYGLNISVIINPFCV